MAGEIPAGWYPNPWNGAEELYWSGSAWTGISRTARRPAASEVEDATMMRPATSSILGQAASAGAPASTPSWRGPGAAAPGQEHPSQQQPGQQQPGQEHPSQTAQPLTGPGTAAPTHPVAQAYGPFPIDARRVADPSAAAATAPGADAASIRRALGDAPAWPGSARTGSVHSRFGLVAVVVGVVAAVFAVVPGLSLAAWAPAFVAIGFGIAGYLRGRPRGLALAGIILGGAAAAIGTAVSIWFVLQLTAPGR